MKRGIFFSTIVIFLLICLIMFLSIQKSITSFYSTQIAVENRIEAMLTFYNNIVRDSKKSMEIMVGRAMCSAINHVIVTGNPLQSSNDTIAELILRGSINGVPQTLMEGSIIEDWEDSIEYLGSLQAFETSVDVNDLLIEPEDSFHISVSYSLSIRLYDDRIVEANLSRTTREKVIISIENLEDPLYPLNTYGRVVNIIRLSPNWLNYSSDDTRNLIDDLNNSYYHPSLYGASFLDRLEGKYFVQNKYFKQKPIGLESFVNKDRMISLGLLVNTSATNIDYLYFSKSNVTAYRIVDMPDNFRLDDEETIEGKTHLQIYNVTVIT